MGKLKMNIHQSDIDKFPRRFSRSLRIKMMPHLVIEPGPVPGIPDDAQLGLG